MTRSRPTQLNAVHEDDVHEVLEEFGVLGDVASGALTCAVCADPLTAETLGAVRFGLGALLFTCQRLDCIAQLSAADPLAHQRDPSLQAGAAE